MTATAPSATPSSDAETQACLIEFLSRRFPGLASAGVDADTPLLESGHVDSLGVLDVMMFIEERFNVPVSDQDFLPEHFDSVTALCNFIRRAARE